MGLGCQPGPIDWKVWFGFVVFLKNEYKGTSIIIDFYLSFIRVVSPQPIAS